MSEETDTFTTEAWCVTWRGLSLGEESEIRWFARNNQVTLARAMHELYPRLWTKLMRLSK